MSLTYPHIAIFGASAQVLEFEDGLQLIVRSGTFVENFEVKIDKVTGEMIVGQPALTAAYVFVNFKDLDTGDESKAYHPVPNKKILLTVPSLVETTAAPARMLHSKGKGYPQPDLWAPRPDVGVDPISSTGYFIEFNSLSTFHVTQD
ncbi:MAG: hypothetical protein H0U74_11865 [Bradymonadaceae bacterium]|nr:hypothetical protein [Lujinxingiaceae bacterium]